MRATDSYSASNIAATTDAFELKGGYYKVAAVATFGGGSVAFEMLGPDGSTWLVVDATNTTLTAAGHGNAAVPPGKYRLAIATATAVYASVVRIPGE